MNTTAPYVNIHTHRPTGRGVELRTAGVHPWRAGAEDPLALWPFDESVQAVGEIGLDFACDVPREQQERVFRTQLQLAQRSGLPVVLHCVRAFGEVMRALAQTPPRAVVFHGFIGSPEQAQQACAAGYHLSFGEGAFRSPKTLRALGSVPLDRLFLETDESPEPIEAIYARTAEALHLPVGELREILYTNYQKLFESL